METRLATFTNLIKTQDNFGHRVAFNFNRNGDSYKTIIGGLVSIFIYIMVFSLVILRMSQMSSSPGDETLYNKGIKYDFFMFLGEVGGFYSILSILGN